MTDFDRAILLLDHGEVVGIPTETVYGLAARIDRPDSLKKIFQTKARPFFDPLIVHVASALQARACVSEWGAIADALAKQFWPGPLTLVLPKSDVISGVITSGLQTVGIRCPRHPVALELLRRIGTPLAAPSANRFGRTSPTSRQHVIDEFENSVLVLEGGECEVGIESTIIAITGDVLKLLRPGAVTKEQIQSCLRKERLKAKWDETTPIDQAPGQMRHHYMPEKPLIIFRERFADDEMLQKIREKMHELPEQIEGVHLLRPAKVESWIELRFDPDPVLAARELYQKLRQASHHVGDVMILFWPEERRHGDWLAVWDRLRKAASLHFD